MRRTINRSSTAFAVAALLVAMGALSATALAHRAPTPRERSAITGAIRRSSETRMLPCFRVRGIVVSTVGPWARARVQPCNPARYDGADAVVRRAHGHWTLRELGTALVGCDVVPRAVRRDLRISCPPRSPGRSGHRPRFAG